MKYMGSKSRHAKEIIPILMQEYEQGMHYIEPFVGGANIIDKIPIPNHLKFAFDVHEYLIAMWEAVSWGWDAPEFFFTEEDYRQVKETMCEKDPITAYAGFALSYGGKWFGGWCRQKKREGHIIFVSEYSMPEDFECVWSKRVNSSLTKDTGGKKNVERLFKL